MKLSLLVLSLFGIMLVGPAISGAQELPAVADLTAVLDTGVVLMDGNDDRVIDDLRVDLLLPRDPSAAEVAAAANLAARLGFETSAADLGLVRWAGGSAPGAPGSGSGAGIRPVILVGARAAEAQGFGGLLPDARAGLAPGQGVVLSLPVGGRGPAGGVALLGYDATGLLGAADYLAGRYPGIWSPGGTSWSEVVEKVMGLVRDHDLGEAVVSLDRIVVETGRPGIPRARATVSFPDTAAFNRALRVLRGRGALEADSTVAVGLANSAVGDAADLGAAADADSAATTGHVSAGSRGAGAAADSMGGAGRTAAGEGLQEAQEATDTTATPVTASDLEFEGLHRLDLLVQAPGQSQVVTLRPDRPWELEEDRVLQPGSNSSFYLPDLYEVGGLFRDTNRDLVPDETAAFLSLAGGEAAGPVVDLATRIGLETAGIRLPLVRVDAQENDPSNSGFPIFLGTDHYQIRRLQEDGKISEFEMGPGHGFVQLVQEAFGDESALAIGGTNDEGLASAVEWISRRAPYLWRYGKGEYRLQDAQQEVRWFLQGRRASGQAALALAKLETWMERMEENPPSRVEVELALEEAPAGLDRIAESTIQRHFPEASVEAGTWSTGFGVGDTVFVQEWEIPWEVDQVRGRLEDEVYPRIQAGEPANVEVRISEPPEIRASLEEEIRQALQERGASEVTVHVLSAYKQGYSWIHDVLLPQLRGEPVGSIELTYHTLEESEEVRWQTIAAETRWLQEVYPIDAVLARELGIPDSVMTFHPTRERDPIYTFEARSLDGEVLLRDTFDPKYVVRPFFDLFPEYEKVRVTTGWLSARSGGEVIVDERVVTDPERFWDRLQTETYGEIISYFMDSQDGDPSGSNAPFFDEFRVDLRLSEPDYRIGIDEETISSLEALHEDLFFETHTLFSLLGGRYQTSTSNPGRVLPFVDPSGTGKPGTARLVLTGKTRGNPKLLVRTWEDAGAEPILKEYELDPLPAEEVGVSGVAVRAGEEGLRELRVRVEVPDSLDRYEEFAARSSEAAIDREFLSVELLEGMLRAMGTLHDEGLMEEALSWDRVQSLVLDFRLANDSIYRKEVVLPRSRNPQSTDNPRLSAPDWRYGGDPIVQWETPISVEENETLLARLATFPEVRAYYLTDSYLGHHVWAADVLPPHDARYISQAKLNALKPTLLVSGREHANEVSSTSHILRLGELLVTDSAHRELLKKVNVVLHPMTNPDGTALAYARQLVNPDHMLHAGRPGALGSDATSGASADEPVYPESQARVMLREAWLPDIYLNPHGYPSHEWVQYFAGYSAWARGRRVGPRTWWVPRGWFIPGFSWVEDEENPEYKTAQFAILDSMAAAVTGDPEVDELNRRLYTRYKKYGEQDRDGFTEYFHNGMVVNMRLRGSESIGTGLNSPRITYFSVTTEAPDETARGEYLDLMGKVGLAHTSSTLRYLAGGEYEVKRETQAYDDAVVRKIFRIKPVLPPGEG